MSYRDDQRTDRQRFLRDTRHHRMEVVRDDGVYRHIRMKKPGNIGYHFDISTYPGYLVFTGDMGSYVFSRLRDMFEFHRTDWDRDTPTIDYKYWSQKCEAPDRNGGVEEFCAAKFMSSAVRAFRDHDWPDSKTKLDNWRTYFRPDILEEGHRDSGEATGAMMDFSYYLSEDIAPGHIISGRIHPFSEFYDNGPFTRPSYHFRWVCWAIAHTIRDYDLGGDRFARQAKHDIYILGGETQ